MKKLIISCLLVVLVIPGLALSEDDKGTRRPARREGAHHWSEMKLEPVAGKIVSLSANAVTVATPVKAKDAKAKFKHVKVRTSGKPDLRGLLAKGLGKKAKLLCKKTDKGALLLVRIKSIEGLELPSQESKRRGSWEGMHEKGKKLNPEQRKRMRDRFRAVAKRLRENPELREELKNLAKKDVEAFRQRIRRIHAEVSKSIKGDGTTTKPKRAVEDKATTPASRRGSGRQARAPRRTANPQIAKLEQQSQQLAKRYRQAEGQDKEELGDKLRGTLSQVFKLKVQMQAKQVEQLEKQLKRLREGLGKREHNRETMIQKRFGQLTGEEEDLPW